LDQYGPLKRDELVKLEEKNKELEKALEDEKAGNSKERKEALEALQKKDYSKAQRLFAKIREKEKEKESQHAKTAYNLGNAYFVDLKFKPALESYLEAERLDPGNALYLNEIGFIYDKLAEYKKAIDYYEKALAIDLKTYGKEHPDVAIDWNNLGNAWDSLGEYKKAIDYYNKALAIDLKTYGKEHPKVAIRWNNLGGAWDSLGEYKKAIDYYNKALNIFKLKLGPTHPSTKTVKENLSFVQQKLKESKK